jgi:hypothetical protein
VSGFRDRRAREAVIASAELGNPHRLLAFDRFADQLAAQQRIVDRAKFLSPAILDHDSQVPCFEFEEESPGALTGRVAVGLAGGGLPAVLVAGFAVLRLRRYPVMG